MLFKESRHPFDESDHSLAVITFSSKEELLAYPMFTCHSETPVFHQFSLQEGDALMLEEDEGKVWLLLGMIEGTEEEIKRLGFPEWVPNTPFSARSFVEGGQTLTEVLKDIEALDVPMLEIKELPPVKD